MGFSISGKKEIKTSDTILPILIPRQHIRTHPIKRIGLTLCSTTTSDTRFFLSGQINKNPVNMETDTVNMYCTASKYTVLVLMWAKNAAEEVKMYSSEEVMVIKMTARPIKSEDKNRSLLFWRRSYS